jgi:hypothetical protein
MGPKYYNPELIEVFQAYSDVIVNILDDSTFEEYEILMLKIEMEVPFESDIWDYLKKHERTFITFTNRYLEIEDMGGDVEKAVLKNNQFIKYINGIKKKRLGRIEDENELDSTDRLFWNRQILFKEIIEKNLLKEYKTGKGGYTYTTVNDVLNFFSGIAQTKSLLTGGDLYKNFLNENGNYDFNLTFDSIGKYMNGIERYFHKKRIRYEGDRLTIYSVVN